MELGDSEREFCAEAGLQEGSRCIIYHHFARQAPSSVSHPTFAFDFGHQLAKLLTIPPARYDHEDTSGMAVVQYLEALCATGAWHLLSKRQAR